jgi:hypothetical protein
MTTTAFPTSITRQLVPDHQRVVCAGNIFGIHFPLHFEPFLYAITERIASEYKGGYWEFYTLSNGGFYMAPHSDKLFEVSCENGFEGQLSADALGIAACLYAYSNLSFGDGAFAQVCAEQYHLLREYMFEHSEVGSILGAID